MAEENKSNEDSIFKNWKTILAIVGVLILVFELIGMGLLNTNIFAGKSNTAFKTGKAEFVGTIRTYEPYIFLPSQPMSAELFESIRSIPGVVDVSQENNGLIVKVETRDDVYSVALALKKMGLNPYSLANIAAPSVVAVVLDENGQKVNASLSGVPIKAEVQPLIQLDSEVTVSMLVAVQDNFIVQYGAAVVKSEDKPITFSGVVEDSRIKYVFSIPWENRNSIDIAGLNATYNRSDMGVFQTEISINQLTTIKQFDYVSYVDKKTVIFAENFTDSDKAISDFGVNISFLPSLLIVTTKDENFSLPYNYTVSYIYTISPNASDYLFVDNRRFIEFESSDLIKSNEVNISAVAKIIGNVVLELQNISIS
ncbi:MAG: hypothetical protein QXU76_01640 [Candidatus Bilamarchaeaceae archaeon]